MLDFSDPGACGLIAILRGIRPEEAEDIAEVLVAAGWPAIEVPLNSPDPFLSISRMMERVGDQAMIGAGTVLRVEEVDQLADLGAAMVVSPNCDPLVIARSKAKGMLSLPGVFTATEAFQALDAGADGLKLFPASQMGPAGVGALKAVLPAGLPLLAVGGVAAPEFSLYRKAGCCGFGIGSALYRPGDDSDSIQVKAAQLRLAWDQSQ